ncbi:MAG: homoserine dehydrogenase, partial [Planctomycetota bacterium]
MAEKIVKVGLAGFGTVGCGVAKLITEDADVIAAKTGLRLELACVVDIDTKSARPVKLPDGILTDKLDRLLDDDTIQIGIEAIGGTDTAKQVQLKMLEAGKDVVTANKALLAEYGNELYRAAQQNGRCIAFEASCAAAIPIVSAIRTGLTANNITGMYGIVNGTCNYILSNMTAQDEDFSAALAQAQEKGYAEADPTLDISGGDSAHKLAILASIAFGYEIALDDIFVEGIESISKDDICYGGEMGYCLKLLAIGEKDEQDKVSLRVHPSFIAKDGALARVSGPFNAISIFGSAVGQVTYYGRGAGMMPTASAVVADIIDVALGNSATTFSHLHLRPRNEVESLIEKIDNIISRFYIRIMCKDQPGVIAQWSKILADHQISISGA